MFLRIFFVQSIVKIVKEGRKKEKSKNQYVRLPLRYVVLFCNSIPELRKARAQKNKTCMTATASTCQNFVRYI